MSGVVPNLPGYAPSHKFGARSYARKQQFGFLNGVPTEASEKKHAAPTSSQSLSGTAGKEPAWLVFDRTTLCFQAYFKEAVHERADEHFRVRKVKIFFFPVDDTIEVIEPTQTNSGLPQGKLIRRQRILKADGVTPYLVNDLNIGIDVAFYGRHFRIYESDDFTKRFLTKLGITVGTPESAPDDPYTQKLEQEAAAKQALRPYDKLDKLDKFLKHDRQVLRFYGVWDDSGSEYGERRYFVVTYYLSDDTIEVTEVVQANSGRSGSAVFLSRCQLPKDASTHVRQPGAVTERTLLNVTGRDGVSILDNLHTGSGAGEHYSDRDLEIGTELMVFNRPVLLCDCDEFTKEYYRTHYGVEDFTPINLDGGDGGEGGGGASSFEEAAASAPKPIIDAANDCMARLTYDPPKPDMKKAFDNGAAALCFKAQLEKGDAIALARRFTISFYLADDSIAVFEELVPNSGIKAGKFLERTTVYSPDGSRVMRPDDFVLNGTVEINRWVFVVTDAAKWTFEYMRENGFWAQAGPAAVGEEEEPAASAGTASETAN